MSVSALRVASHRPWYLAPQRFGGIEAEAEYLRITQGELLSEFQARLTEEAPERAIRRMKMLEDLDFPHYDAPESLEECLANPDPSAIWDIVIIGRRLGSHALYLQATRWIDAALPHLARRGWQGLRAYFEMERAACLRDFGDAEAVPAMARVLRICREDGDEVTLVRGLLLATEYRSWSRTRFLGRRFHPTMCLVRRAYEISRARGWPHLATVSMGLARYIASIAREVQPDDVAFFDDFLGETSDARDENERDERVRVLQELLRLEKRRSDHRDMFGQRLQSAADQMSEGILVFEAIKDSLTGRTDYRNIAINLAAQDLFQTALGQQLSAMNPAFRHAVDAIIAENGAEREVEFQSAHYMLRSSHLRNGWLMITVRDVSAYRMMLARAQDSERRMREFLAMASHEVRSPLHGMLGLARSLAADATLNDAARERARLIADSGTSLVGVLNEILDLAKSDAGQLRSTPRPAPLREVIEIAGELFRPLASENSLRLRIGLTSRIPDAALIDEGRLSQILHNLLGNAVKFSPRGGSVRLDADMQEDELVLSVTDEAGGIPEEELSQLFEPYVQGESGRRVGGTGLGLPLSFRLAATMGGSLSYVPAPTGSSFVLRVPAPACASLEPGEQENEPLPLRTLVVDDLPVNRLILSEMLAKMGAEVIEADSGTEAVRIAESHPLDLILMDVHMPGLDGFSATQEIRRLGIETPVYAVTAGHVEKESPSATRHGMNGVLAKPLTAFALRHVLKGIRRAA